MDLSKLRPGQKIIYHGYQGIERGVVTKQDYEDEKVWCKWEDGEELFLNYDTKQKIELDNKLERVLA